MNSIRHTLYAVLVAVSVSAPAMAQDAKRVLVFGDSNSWGWIARPEGFPASRLADQDRFAGVIAAELGAKASVVVNGLVGRTTDADRAEGIGPVPASGFNGAAHLPAAIAAQGPFDLVIVMLGTNDVSAALNRTPDAVGAALSKLALTVRAADKLVFSNYAPPQVLLVAPPPYGDTTKTPLSGLFSVGEKPSRELGAAILSAAQTAGIPAFDAGSVIRQVGGVDGVHMSGDDHRILGKALSAEVAKLLK